MNISSKDYDVILTTNFPTKLSVFLGLVLVVFAIVWMNCGKWGKRFKEMINWKNEN